MHALVASKNVRARMKRQLLAVAFLAAAANAPAGAQQAVKPIVSKAK